MDTWGWPVEAAAGGVLWLLGLSAGLGLVGGRLARLRAEQAVTAQALARIQTDVARLRRDLAGVASRQQVADLRGQLVADLRPIIGEAVAVQFATRPRGGRGRAVGVEFAGTTTIAGPVAGHDVREEDAS